MRICNFCKDGFVLYITNNFLYFVGYTWVFKPIIEDAIIGTDSEVVLIVVKRLFPYLPKKRLTIKIIIYILEHYIRIYVLYREKDLINRSMESEIYFLGNSILKKYG